MVRLSKKTISFIFGLFLVPAIYIIATNTNPEVVNIESNLVLNSSLEKETDSGDRPRFWQTGGYGQNDRVFRYPVSGLHDGTAAYVEIINHVDGDAKWFFNDIAIIPESTYVFSNYYKSNVASKVFVRFNTRNCFIDETDCLYKKLIEVPPAEDWSFSKISFEAPTDALSMTIFQLIDSNGWLYVDEFALITDTPTDIKMSIPNSSLQEQLTDGNEFPIDWEHASYGENNAIFEYVQDDGHNDSKSVKVTITDYISGDAKWNYLPQSVSGGEDYRFSAWYKTNTVPHVVVQFIDGTGRISFYGLPRPEPKNDKWQLYTSEFSVPSNIIFASVFFYIDSNGWLQTDDYLISPYEYTGFDEPIVTLTFDDGIEENVLTALPVMERFGLESTQCYMTSNLVGNEEQITKMRTFMIAGHEICSHTVSHHDLTTLTPEELEQELKNSKEFLQKTTNTLVPYFASPYGAYNLEVINEIKKHYEVHRTVNEGYNSADNLDLYRLKVQNMHSDTTLAEFQEWVNKAKEDKTWLILVYHNVNSANIGPFGTYTDDFVDQMEWLASTGITVKRLDEAVAEVSSFSE